MARANKQKPKQGDTTMTTEKFKSRPEWVEHFRAKIKPILEEALSEDHREHFAEGWTTEEFNEAVEQTKQFWASHSLAAAEGEIVDELWDKKHPWNKAIVIGYCAQYKIEDLEHLENILNQVGSEFKSQIEFRVIEAADDQPLKIENTCHECGNKSLQQVNALIPNMDSLEPETTCEKCGSTHNYIKGWI